MRFITILMLALLYGCGTVEDVPRDYQVDFVGPTDSLSVTDSGTFIIHQDIRFKTSKIKLNEH